MRENMDQKNSEYGHFSRNEIYLHKIYKKTINHLQSIENCFVFTFSDKIRWAFFSIVYRLLTFKNTLVFHVIRKIKQSVAIFLKENLLVLMSTCFNFYINKLLSCSRRVGNSRWWGSLTMVPAGNKAKRLSSVNHTTKTIHHQFIIIKFCILLVSRIFFILPPH